MDVKKTRDWSLLPYDIVCEVFLKTDTIQDFVYFSIICRTWSHAFSIIKSKWKSKFPLLLLPENTRNNDEYLRKVFSLNRKKCWELKLPQTFGSRCWGSSCGWIAMIDLNRQISLFNPFSQTQIFLPSQSTIPNQLPEDDFRRLPIPYNKMIRDKFFHKIVVLKMGGGDDILVIAFRADYKNNEALALARPGDKVWTSVITPNIDFVFDIICWCDKMFLLYNDGALGYFTITRDQQPYDQPLKALDYCPSSNCITPAIGKKMSTLYLVDILGHLHMVARYKIYFLPKQSYSFEVFKINFETKKWDWVKDLGDFALFVGNNVSMSIRASRCNNINRNYIYFTDDFYHEWWIKPSAIWPSCDLGFFNLETKESNTFYHGDDDIISTFCPPLWFMPSFS